MGDFMKLTVIGCWGGFPAANGATASYILEKDGFVLIVDMGSGSLSNIQTFVPMDQFDAVLLSHYHHDHIADIGVLQYGWLVDMYVTGRKNKLPIYGHAFDQEAFTQLTSERTEGIVYHPEKTLEIGPFKIQFLKTKHPVPCFAMRITDGNKTIVYTADSAYTEDFIPFAKDADLLIADCNLYAHQDGAAAGHMTSRECGIIAKEACVRELLLSHLPQFGKHANLLIEAEKEFKGLIHLASKGFVWE